MDAICPQSASFIFLTLNLGCVADFAARLLVTSYTVESQSEEPPDFAAAKAEPKACSTAPMETEKF